METISLNYNVLWPDIVPEKNVRLGQSCTTAHLIYLRNYRCSSTYFYQNFVENMKWIPIEEFKDINWENKTVFSHIAEPIKRRHKGIAHWLQRHKLVEKYFNDISFQNYITSFPYLDNHSASYHHMIGERIMEVNWILCDYDNHDFTIEQTVKFLNSHYIMYLGYFDKTIKNESSTTLKKLTDHIEQCFLKNSDKSTIIEYFKKDIDLYYKLKKEVK